MREIDVQMFLRPMGAGITRPALVIGDDCQEYIIKNESVDENGNIVNYNCMFLNELLAFQIGNYLGVPMPEAVVAVISKELVDYDPTIRFSYRFERGKFFATKKLEKVENNIYENYQELIMMKKPYMERSWKKFFKDIENKEDVSKILAFDILIANFDRYVNSGNVLIDSGSSKRRIYAIDNGHSFFGPIWNEAKINCLNLSEVTDSYIELFSTRILEEVRRTGVFGSGTIFGALEQHIDLEDVENHAFSDVINNIRNIEEDMIRSWCNNIPDEWFINREIQTAYYIKFILKQKFVVEHIIQLLANQNAFTNFRGGILKYGEEKENCI